MKKEEIKELIKTDKGYAIGALLRLYEFQEPQEQNSKATAVNNDYGFNKIDAGILSDLAQFYYKKGFLTDKQIQLMRTKILKYIRQLSEVGFDKVEINQGQEKPKKKKHKKKQAYIKDETTIELSFDYDKDVIYEIKQINGRKFDVKNKSWSIPLTLVNLDKLIDLEFKFSKELNEWYKKQTEGITDQISVPKLDDVLMNFQKEAVSFIESKNGRALIADQQGLGKTLESIAWLQLRGKEVLPALIICPASLKLNWKNEIEKFTDLGNNVEVLYGKTPYQPSKSICIINYDIIYDWRNYIVSKMKPETVIYDECHYLKNKSANRTKGSQYIAKYTRNCIGLTGTPILNRPIEIYEPLKMIKPTLFPHFKAFAYKYCNPKFNGFGMSFDGSSNTVELHQILAREVMIRRKKETVLKELPEKTRSILPLDINNRKEYKKAEEDLIAYLNEIDPEKAKRASRAEVLTKINTLKQLATKGKMDQAIEWVENFIDAEKLVLFVHYKDTVNKLIEKLGDKAVKIVGGMSGEKRQESEKRFWNEDSVRVLVGNIEAAGTGLNLQVASNVAFIEYPWSPGAYQQAEDRVHRKGQTDAVMCWNLVASETIEESIVKMLDQKSQVISEVVDGDQSEDSGIFNELIDQFSKK